MDSSPPPSYSSARSQQGSMKPDRSHQHDREKAFMIYAHTNIHLVRRWRNRIKLEVCDSTTMYELLVMIADRAGYSLVGYHFWCSGRLIWEGKKWTDKERKTALKDLGVAQGDHIDVMSPKMW